MLKKKKINFKKVLFICMVSPGLEKIVIIEIY